MKTFQYTPDTLICNCPNQGLLLHGDICDLCMGVVEGKDGLDQTSDSIAGDPFDELYFEALESYYEDITFAA